MRSGGCWSLAVNDMGSQGSRKALYTQPVYKDISRHHIFVVDADVLSLPQGFMIYDIANHNRAKWISLRSQDINYAGTIVKTA
jgi:hypothetical protein